MYILSNPKCPNAKMCIRDRLNTFIKEKKCKNVSVIGGGFIGVEVAENLKEAGYNEMCIRDSYCTVSPWDTTSF